MQLGELQFGEMPHFFNTPHAFKKWRNATRRNAPHPIIFIIIFIYPLYHFILYIIFIIFFLLKKNYNSINYIILK